jgi:hypothetical protein
MWGGFFAIRARSAAGVSPVRTSTRIGTSGSPRRAARLDPGERLLEVLLDVGAERLEGRDVEDLGHVAERSLDPLPDEIVERREEGGEGLARSRRGGHEGVRLRADRRPGLALRGRRLRKARLEPRADDRMEEIENGGLVSFVGRDSSLSDGETRANSL